MSELPDIPLYTAADASWLYKAVDPKHSVVLPRHLWNNKKFRELPDGAKLLYGIIYSKITKGDIFKKHDDKPCIRLTVKEIERLLSCSKKKAQTLLSDLVDAGYVNKYLVNEPGYRGGFNIVSLSEDIDIDCHSAVTIPHSLFQQHTFQSLPDSAKLIYGAIYAGISKNAGCIDCHGLYYVSLPAKRIQILSNCSKDKQRKCINELRDKTLIAEKRVGRRNLYFVRHLGKDTEKRQ